MRTLRNRSWKLAVTQMNGLGEDRNAWRIPSALTGKRRRAPIPAMQGPGGHILGRPEQKAEFLAYSFERHFPPNGCKRPDFLNLVQHEIIQAVALPITAEPEPISRNEVSDRLAELRPRKVSGPDGVFNTALSVFRKGDRGSWSKCSTLVSE